eukprot:g618.t1
MLQYSSAHCIVAAYPFSFAISNSAFSRTQNRPVLRTPHGRRPLTAMASNEGVATVYANALATLADSTEKLEVIHRDIDQLSKLLNDTEGLAEFLSNPITDKNKKQSVLSTLCKEEGFDQYTVNFLNLVMEKGRASFLIEMCNMFEEQYCKMSDTLVVTLTSAVQLDESERFEIVQKLQELSGAKYVKLKPVIDPRIIAGFTLEYGSSQIDLSVKGQLERLSQQLISAD